MSLKRRCTVNDIEKERELFENTFNIDFNVLRYNKKKGEYEVRDQSNVSLNWSVYTIVDIQCQQANDLWLGWIERSKI